MRGRAIAYALTLCILVLLVPIAWFSYTAWAPHLLLNETARYLYQYREIERRDGAIDLVPGLFKTGEPKQDIDARLLAAGLERWPATGISVPPAAVSVEMFRLVAGHNLVCGYELYLTLAYDAAAVLQGATVAQGGVCL